MKKTLFLTLICFISVSIFGQHGYAKEELILSWEDDFNSNQLDTSRWSKIPRGTADWQNYMSDFDKCYDIKDSNLILRGIVNT